MSKQYVKLVMVTKDNNNKFYEMTHNGGSSFDVLYGRIESSQVRTSYPIGMWNAKYNEKIRKGYKDVTDLIAAEVVVNDTPKIEYVDIADPDVAEFITVMKKYTDGLVSRVYSVKSTSVSQKQVDEAQKLLDTLSDLAKAKKQDVTVINTKLIELYMVIPRYIKDVRREILPHIQLDKVLSQEQDNLDAMSSQVNMNKKSEPKTKSDVPKKVSILEQLGVKMRKINSNADVDKYVKQISGMKVKSIFEVDKEKENNIFEKWLSAQTNKKTTVVLHGTRCTSVIPILEQGLKIRPAGNFQFTGKVYGNGNYFSEQSSTSIGYTGHDNDKVLLVYEVHTGKESKSAFNDYSSCKRAGYDSFEGGWLRVAYNEQQSRIKYIIWLK